MTAPPLLPQLAATGLYAYIETMMGNDESNSHSDAMRAHRGYAVAGDLSMALVYIFINLLFIWKYSVGYFHLPGSLSLLYPPIISVVLFLPSKIRGGRLSSGIPSWAYSASVLLIALTLIVIMKQFDPLDIEVGRYNATTRWIERLFQESFPYSSQDHPSGFPFLFVLAMPFHLLGDSGYLQIVSFAILARFLFTKERPDLIGRWRRLILLSFAPVFLYETVVRSELFSNMVMVLLYIDYLHEHRDSFDTVNLLLFGLLGGFVLSTRLVAWLVFIIYFAYLSGRMQRSRYFMLLISAVVGFSLTVFPFLIWNSNLFMNEGPFAIQLSYVPWWLMALTAAAALVCGMFIKSSNGLFFGITMALFGVVFAAFLISVFRFGLIDSVTQDFFDISYFAYCLPFLLMSLKEPGEHKQKTGAIAS